MRLSFKNRKRLLVSIGALAAVLALGSWLFGWGRGTLDIMEFSASSVDRIELSCTDVTIDLHRAVVTEKDDIQALIDSFNSLQFTGSSIKELFRYGLPIGALGGSLLYEVEVWFSNGDRSLFLFASNTGGQEASDMDLLYWTRPLPDGQNSASYTCRGSMEAFYEMYSKYWVTG